MILPSQVRPPGTKSKYHAQQVASLEKRCDEAIQRADAHQSWPACIPQPRTPYERAVVDEVFEKYKAAGWRVVQPFGGVHALTIDRPVKP